MDSQICYLDTALQHTVLRASEAGSHQHGAWTAKGDSERGVKQITEVVLIDYDGHEHLWLILWTQATQVELG